MYYNGLPHHNIDAYLRSDCQRVVEEIFKTEMENMGAIQHEIDGEEEYNLLTQAQNLDMMTEDQQKRYFSLKELYNG